VDPHQSLAIDHRMCLLWTATRGCSFRHPNRQSRVTWTNDRTQLDPVPMPWNGRTKTKGAEQTNSALQTHQHREPEINRAKRFRTLIRQRNAGTWRKNQSILQCGRKIWRWKHYRT
jgi:hypothetical protein